MAEIMPLTVTQATGVVIEKLKDIRIKIVGEVTGHNPNARYSAVYFSVKDEDSVLACIMWRPQFSAIDFDFQNGMLVELTGKFQVYPKRGSLQFEVSSMKPAGEGDLKAQLARREEMLRKEGLFDDARKLPIPLYPKKVALITSPSGAAVHDVLKTLRRRYPLIEVDFYGVRVEGEAAEPEIIQALLMAEQSDVDVVLLVRGGGSQEDLLAFSGEQLVRTVAGLRVPVVTGIGHEPDRSIADLAADKAASTPTASAEAITPDSADLKALFERIERSMAQSLKSQLSLAKSQLHTLSSREIFKDPKRLTGMKLQQIDSLSKRLSRAIPDSIMRDRNRLERATTRLQTLADSQLKASRSSLSTLAASLDALSPLKVLGRGYAALFDAGTKAVVASVKQVKVKEEIVVRLADGSLDCTVNSVSEGA